MGDLKARSHPERDLRARLELVARSRGPRVVRDKAMGMRVGGGQGAFVAVCGRVETWSAQGDRSAELSRQDRGDHTKAR